MAEGEGESDCCSKWFKPCNHKSLFCRQIPSELHNVEFPWFRQVFLFTAMLMYIGDTGLDIFVAYEHHKHYLEGDEDAKWYFILTIVFIVIPSVVMNFVSWGLYTWCYLVNNIPQLREYLRNKSRRLKESIGSALMYLNYVGSYSPAGTERRQWERAAPPNELRPDGDLYRDVQRIANNSRSYSEFDHQIGDDEVDTKIEFRAVDELTFTSLVLITILHVCQLGLFVRAIRIIYLSSKSNRSYYRYYDLTFLKLIESFMEAAPQLILQLYVYIVSPQSDLVYRIVTPISLLFSLVSLALAITDYHSAGKDTCHYIFNTEDSDRYPRLSWTAYFVIIFWQLCLIISRTLAFAFFATEFGLYLFVFLLVHFLVMVVWIYSSSYRMFKGELVGNDENDSKRKQLCNYCILHPFQMLTRNCFLEFIIAAFNSFFFFKFTETSKTTAVLYYILLAVENIVLISLFIAFTDSPVKWNNITGFISTFVSFVLGVGYMLLYYCYYHPVNTSRNNGSETDLGTAIKRNLPSEFYGKTHLTFATHWLFITEDKSNRVTE